MRINGFEQIKGFYSWAFDNQQLNVRTTHIALYMFLVNQNNRNKWVEWFKCPFDLAMGGSGITNKNTYYKTLKDLQEWGLIEYKKGVNNFKAPLIKLEVLFDTAIVPQSEPQVQPQSIPLPVPLLQPQLTNNIKQVTNNIEQITLNINSILDFLNCNDLKEDKNKDLYFITTDDFLETWNKARKTLLKVESNIKSMYLEEKTNFNILKDKYTKEEFKDAMRGLFMQKDMFPSNLLRPKHFLSDGNVDKYLDAFKNDTQLYKNKKHNDVKL